MRYGSRSRCGSPGIRSRVRRSRAHRSTVSKALPCTSAGWCCCTKSCSGSIAVPLGGALQIELSTTEDTEDAEKMLGFLRVLRVLRGGEFDFAAEQRVNHRVPTPVARAFRRTAA